MVRHAVKMYFFNVPIPVILPGEGLMVSMTAVMFCSENTYSCPFETVD